MLVMTLSALSARNGIACAIPRGSACGVGCPFRFDGMPRQEGAGQIDVIARPLAGRICGARLSRDAAGWMRLPGFLWVPLMGAALGSTEVSTAHGSRLTWDSHISGN